MSSGFIRKCEVMLVLFLAGGFFFGCSRFSRQEEELVGADYYFDRGMRMMDKKDYPKAIENFQLVVDSFPGSPLVDHAQFMLAEAHFKNEEYVTAAYEYERVFADYPSSRFAPEAQYKRALCYYMESPDARLDQSNTYLAIDEFNRFIDTYPSNPLVKDAQEKIEELRAKLAYKEYLNAEQYRKMKHYEAALIYYRFVISDYPRTPWADYARFGIGEVHFAREEYEKAKDLFQILVNKSNIDSGLREKAVKMLDKIRKIESK